MLRWLTVRATEACWRHNRFQSCTLEWLPNAHLVSFCRVIRAELLFRVPGGPSISRKVSAARQHLAALRAVTHCAAHRGMVEEWPARIISFGTAAEYPSGRFVRDRKGRDAVSCLRRALDSVKIVRCAAEPLSASRGYALRGRQAAVGGITSSSLALPDGCPNAHMVGLRNIARVEVLSRVHDFI